MKRLISLLLLSFIIVPDALAQNLVSVELLKNSSLTISGSTNVVSFKLFQSGDKLIRSKSTIEATESQNKLFLSQNLLFVAVKNFSSYNKMALNDFLHLLKADTFPNLQIRINYLDIQPVSEKGQSYSGNALVSITITGITRYYSIPIYIKGNGNQYIVDGKKKMTIRDFGLTPQSKMMGMIKVSEWIDIDFHMICKISSPDDLVKL